MKLDQIKLVHCPQCGCSVIETESKINQHTNGHWNERRTFSCGRELHFSPNFMKVQGEGVCTQSPAYKKAIKSKSEAIERLISYVNYNLGADLTLKVEILSAIRRI